MTQTNSEITVPARYIFLDVVGFSSREVETQAKIVDRLNAVIKESVASIIINVEKVNYIPTGDGVCIWFNTVEIKSETKIESYECHVRLALKILELIKRRGEGEADFSVRIGINENEDIRVTDVNGRPNVAGRGINIASRVMDQADASQILVSASVHERLCQRAAYVGCFRPHQVVFKHAQREIVHQLLPVNSFSEAAGTLDAGEPQSIRRARKERQEGRQISSEGLRMEAYRKCISEASSTLAIVTNWRDWVYPLAPSLVMARHKNVRILVSYYPVSEEDIDPGELRFLKQLGCSVYTHPVQKKAPFRGMLADFHSNSRIHGIVSASKQQQTGIFAQRLQSQADEETLLCLRELLLGRMKQDGANMPELHEKLLKAVPLQMRQGTDDELYGLMGQVRFYQNRPTTFKVEEVRVADTTPLAEDIRLFKHKQAEALVRFFEDYKYPLFQLLLATLENGRQCPLLPPVVEEHAGNLIVAEGHNRLYSLYQMDPSCRVKVVVARGVLPAVSKLKRWSEFKDVDDQRVGTGLPEERIKRNEARYIESDVHRDLWPEVADAKLPRQSFYLDPSLTRLFS